MNIYEEFKNSSLNKLAISRDKNQSHVLVKENNQIQLHVVNAIFVSKIYGSKEGICSVIDELGNKNKLNMENISVKINSN